MRSVLARFSALLPPAVAMLGLLGCDAPGAPGAIATTCAPCASAAPSSGRGGPATPVDASVTLSFRREGVEVRALSLRELAERVAPEVIEVYDPYYNRNKRFRALPIGKVLALAFEGHEKPLAEADFVLRAKDGYTVAMRGSRLLEGGGYIAFEDLEVPGWEPIGPQLANPAPFYFVWSGKGQASLETHPRPWQLAAIEIVRFEDAFPKTVPTGLPEGDPGWQGFALYKEQCVHCHAINRQGGRVGPELNVPRNITEYRPVEQIRAYISNPLAFRYSAMPAHPGFSEANLDELVAYLRAMSERKQDGDAAPKAP